MTSLRESILQLPAILIAMIVFVVIFALNSLGYWTRKRIHRLYPEKEIAIGTAEGSLLGLMALLLAFSFNMAATKFENRRQLIIEEANQLGTAILRCDLYPDSAKQSLLGDFRNYLDSRINYYDAGDDREKIQRALTNAEKHFKAIWNKNAILSRDPRNGRAPEQTAPILISMKNAATAREALRLAPVPSLILIVLLILVCIAAFVAGFGTKPGHRNVVLALLFTVMTTSVLYLIMELGRPSRGIINLDGAEQKIVELRQFFA